ncbi:MAG: SRPBCC family protein [Gammaproteobacteria bacterium]
MYTVKFDGRLAAAPADVYRLVTDHDHLYLLNDIVLESRLLTRPDAPEQQRRVVLHICILFFCRNMKVVESLLENGSDELVATIVPAVSDFKTGRTVWRITPAGTALSRIQMDSTFQPGFWVPPVIGPLLIRKKMEHEMSVMIMRLEHYAGTAPGH